jgi:hypothetical protein
MQQMLLQLEQQKLQLQKYEHDTELRYKYYDTNVDAGLQEAKITVDAIQKKANGESTAN